MLSLRLPSDRHLPQPVCLCRIHHCAADCPLVSSSSSEPGPPGSSDPTLPVIIRGKTRKAVRGGRPPWAAHPFRHPPALYQGLPGRLIGAISPLGWCQEEPLTSPAGGALRLLVCSLYLGEARGAHCDVDGSTD